MGILMLLNSDKGWGTDSAQQSVLGLEFRVLKPPAFDLSSDVV